MKPGSEKWEELAAQACHDLAESLNYFRVAKLNLLSSKPDPVSAAEMFGYGEERIKAVIASLRAAAGD